MDPVVLDDIPFAPSYEEIADAMRVRKGSGHATDLKGLLEEARQIARPKALYKVASIDERGEEHVVIDGIPFHSRILRVNLETLHRVFPYIVTCGRELDAWKASQEDPILNFYAGAINERALNTGRDHLKGHLMELYQIGDSSYMSPGSLDDWPITEQRALFDLLGDPHQAIGVELNPSLMMIPSQTISGIRFSSQETFHSCQLCPMENCPYRQAPYDETLYEEKFKR
ncbi:MAG: hypothetical protein R6U57_03445 [Anaerolineales bacterium]